jgi:hypothetical protein
MEIKTKEQIIEQMQKYNEKDFYLYSCESGFQDWMLEYTEAQDDEEITERELNKIRDIEVSLWQEAHKQEEEQLPFIKVYI